MSANRLKLNADKTEVLWAGSRYGSALLGSAGPSLRLGNQVIPATDHVRVLGVTLSSDLSLSKHVSNACTACFLLAAPASTGPTYARRRVRSDARPRLCSIACDYCNTVLAGAPKSLTDKLQQVLNAAARVVSNTRKYDHGLSELLHDELHWLDIPRPCR